MRGRLLLVLSPVALGCSVPQVEVHDPPAMPLGVPALEDMSGAEFASAGIRDYVAAVSRCLDAETATPEWQRVPSSGGQLAGWCTGRSARRGCPVAAQFEWERDQRAMQLQVLTDDGLRISSVMIEAISVPPAAGWGARLGYAKPLHHGAFDLTFSLFDEERKPPVATVPLGSTLSYAVRWHHETIETIHLDAPGSAHDRLALAVQSDDAFREGFMPQLVALREKVHERISSLGAKKAVCPTRTRNSLPNCRFEEFDAEEQAWLRGTADHEIGAWITAVEDHAPELRAALLRAYPVDRCWP